MARRKTATELRQTTISVRRLIARLGRVLEDYDSANTSAALGHLSMAADRLHAAATAAYDAERRIERLRPTKKATPARRPGSED